ncbi:uncharacterized protein F5147DRAFT_767291 [Suillus discolor]|uniref:Uncharacterized protein n=1 Tax=Suillus discolor TaxID=1912936 RepID=A0A9P7K042_9AGAM|nr:uncharacterized protein F5147DRAFT_767291 [Suillus discolor]KAG2119822.1 hypothetical protein F5147DRAFT_767291 [Suillus discolor]
MGRPRLYKTQEERSEAARRYRKKYYERSKERIAAAKQSLRKKGSTVVEPEIDIENVESDVESEPVQLTNAATVIDIDDVEYKLMKCAQLDKLCYQLANNFLHDQQAVLDALSERLETLVHVEEYLRSATSVHHDHIEGFLCRCKLVVAATEELWCYAATLATGASPVPWPAQKFTMVSGASSCSNEVCVEDQGVDPSILWVAWIMMQHAHVDPLSFGISYN